MTIRELSVACPMCAAQPGYGCVEPIASETERPTLPYFHSARIETAALIAAMDQPGDTHPITDALIDGAGVV